MISYVQDILLPTDSFANVSEMLFYHVFSYLALVSLCTYIILSSLFYVTLYCVN